MIKRLILIVLIIQCIYSSEEVNGTVVKINYPEDLKGKLPSTTIHLAANFSEIPWGSTISGFVKNSTTDEYACTPFILPRNDNQKVLILYAKRGECTFVTKAINAQNAGASMLIIGNNIPNDEGESHDILIDDHTGRQVNIPVGMIHFSPGNTIREQIQSNIPAERDNVWVTVKFQLARSIDNGENTLIEFWNSAGDKATYEFLEEFKNNGFDQLNFKLVQFNPHYITFYKPDKATKVGGQDCVSGKYCLQDFDINNRGSQVIMEEIRQICVLKNHGIDKWYQYMMSFYKICFKNKRINAACSNSTMDKLGINSEKIHKNCFLNSIMTERHWLEDIYDRENQILLDESNLQKHRSLQVYPQVIIDGANYQGRVTGRDVMSAICGTTPSNCPDSFDMDPEPVDHNHSDEWSNDFGFYTLLLLVLTTIGFIVWALMKRQVQSDLQEETEMQISDAVQQYLALNEQKNKFMSKSDITDL